MWQEKRRFQTMDSMGQTHTVLIDVDMLDTPNGQIEGITRFITDDGKRLHRISKGVYLTWDGGTTLKSDDPAAP